jgi:hypothetical protein
MSVNVKSALITAAVAIGLGLFAELCNVTNGWAFVVALGGYVLGLIFVLVRMFVEDS